MYMYRKKNKGNKIISVVISGWRNYGWFFSSQNSWHNRCITFITRINIFKKFTNSYKTGSLFSLIFWLLMWLIFPPVSFRVKSLCNFFSVFFSFMPMHTDTSFQLHTHINLCMFHFVLYQSAYHCWV